MAGDMKTCRTCGIAKSLTEFRSKVVAGKTYHRGNCRSCDNSENRQRYRNLLAAETPVADGPSEKLCSHCQKTLPLSAFSPSKTRRFGVRDECKPCASEIAMAWRDRNYEKDWDTRLRRNFGITLEQYRALLAEQNGLCAICGDPPTIVGYRPSRRQGRPTRPLLVVDHDHATGKVRGLLCIHCNRGIGFLKDDPAIVRFALKYLEERS